MAEERPGLVLDSEIEGSGESWVQEKPHCHMETT